MRLFIVLDIQPDEGEPLPNEEVVQAALAHSTAGEALAEATRCSVNMWLADDDEVAAAKPNRVLREFVDDINQAGGIVCPLNGFSYPVAAADWTDLAGTYLKACEVLGVEPTFSPEEEDDHESAE
jgi:hypothetical protein